MSRRPVLVRDADLEPSFALKRATEPGFLRSLTTWVGGPEGHINSNLSASVHSERCAVGLMRMPVGNRQPGVHVHSVAEIYVILQGEVESFDGQGRTHRAGPLDCLYIPAGVPHGVRATGREDLELIWLHDGIEKLGVSAYLEGEGPYPSDEEVALVPFEALQARWAQDGCDGPRSANWVAGPPGSVDLSPGIAVTSSRVAVGVTVIPPRGATRPLQQPLEAVYVVLTGHCSLESGGEVLPVGRLDAVYCPSNLSATLNNPGTVPLYVLWVLAGR